MPPRPENRFGEIAASEFRCCGFVVTTERIEVAMKRPTAPLARQCGNWKRRRKRRKQSTAAKAAVEKRTGIDGTKRKHTEEIHPAWLVQQAREAKKRGTDSV